MTGKEISVVFYDYVCPREDWRYEIEFKAVGELLDRLRAELAPLGIALNHHRQDNITLEVRGYGDLLNAVRLRSPSDGVANHCLGHVIGASVNRDLLEDIRKGVYRIAFAPETIEPEAAHKTVCHNCGCGC